MSDKVVFLKGATTMSLPPDRVLDAAVGHLDQVIVIGTDKAGKPYYASSVGDQDGSLPQVNAMVDKFKAFLLQQMMCQDEED